MRRARIQVKPNIGGRGNKLPECSKRQSVGKSPDLTKTGDEKEKDGLSMQAIGKDCKDETLPIKNDFQSVPPNSSENNKPTQSYIPAAVQKDENQSSKPSSVAVRRSRIKPQVKVAPKPRSGVGSLGKRSEATSLSEADDPDGRGGTGGTALQEGTKPSGLEKATDSESKQLETNTLSTALSDKENLHSDENQVIHDESTVLVSSSAETEKKPAEDKTEVDKDDHKSKPPKRGRFMKPKPNIIETGRKRMRLPSLSGASDTDEETRQSFKKVPPPVQRVTTVSSPQHSSPHKSPVITVPSKQQQPSDGADLIDSSETAIDSTTVGGDSVIITAAKEARPKPRLEFRKKVVEKKVKRDARRTVALDEPVDKVKMKISELIYKNPSTNRMKSTIEEEERKKKEKERKDEAGSTIGSPTHAGGSVMGSPDRQSIDSRRESAVSEERRPSVGSPDVQEGSFFDGRRHSEDSLPGDNAEDENAGEDNEPLLVPQLKVGPDGQIILNEASLVVDNPNLNKTIEEEGEVIEEFGNAPYKPSVYYGRTAKTKAWSWRETKKFYLALSVIGSDFSMMSSLFPGRNRTDLKKKFKKEEKQNRWLVDKALKDTKTYDLSIFDTLSSSDDEETKKEKKREEKERKKQEKKDLALKAKQEKAKLLEETKKIKKEETSIEKKKPKRNRKKLKSLYFDSSSSEETENVPKKEDEPLATNVFGESIPATTRKSSKATSDGEFTCDLCEKTLKSKSALRAHLYRHAKKIEGDKVGTNQISTPVIQTSSPSDSNNTPAAAHSPSKSTLTLQTAPTTQGSSTPGEQIVFVRTPGQEMVHMYMVSPPPQMPRDEQPTFLTGVPNLSSTLVNTTGTGNLVVTGVANPQVSDGQATAATQVSREQVSVAVSPSKTSFIQQGCGLARRPCVSHLQTTPKGGFNPSGGEEDNNIDSPYVSRMVSLLPNILRTEADNSGPVSSTIIESASQLSSQKSDETVYIDLSQNKLQELGASPQIVSITPVINDMPIISVAPVYQSGTVVDTMSHTPAPVFTLLRTDKTVSSVDNSVGDKDLVSSVADGVDIIGIRNVNTVDTHHAEKCVTTVASNDMPSASVVSNATIPIVHSQDSNSPLDLCIKHEDAQTDKNEGESRLIFGRNVENLEITDKTENEGEIVQIPNVAREAKNTEGKSDEDVQTIRIKIINNPASTSSEQDSTKPSEDVNMCTSVDGEISIYLG